MHCASQSRFTVVQEIDCERAGRAAEQSGQQDGVPFVLYQRTLFQRGGSGVYVERRNKEGRADTQKHRLRCFVVVLATVVQEKLHALQTSPLICLPCDGNPSKQDQPCLKTTATGGETQRTDSRNQPRRPRSCQERFLSMYALCTYVLWWVFSHPPNPLGTCALSGLLSILDGTHLGSTGKRRGQKRREISPTERGPLLSTVHVEPNKGGLAGWAPIDR